MEDDALAAISGKAERLAHALRPGEHQPGGLPFVMSPAGAAAALTT
jgi:hypothetical protein